jgi:hypothetical protein
MTMTTLEFAPDRAVEGRVGIDIDGDAKLSDAALCDGVATAIARPKEAEANSFVLHAPLELLARTALLPLVDPASRDRARARLAWLRDTYAAAGREVAPPVECGFEDPTRATGSLAGAIAAGDLDAADAAAHGLATSCAPVDLVPLLADLVLPRLSAAGHGPIFLYQLRRVAPRSRAAAGALRGLVRELARQPAWELSWQRRADDEHTPCREPRDDGRELAARLRRPPSPGDPGSDFIYPTMSLVERSGLAAELLTEPTRSLDATTASRVLARIAAWSMLQDDPDRAPYGWSHCLSMPQAVLGIADACSDPRAAVRIAATYSLGFRATQGRVALDPDATLEQGRAPNATPAQLLTEAPGEAASAAWCASGPARREWITALATRAAIHSDAHLAKYTVACLDAAAADPAAEQLYLAAAAFLSAWWARLPSTDPLLAS